MLEGSPLRVVELGSICQSVPGGDIPGMSRGLVLWLEETLCRATGLGVGKVPVSRQKVHEVNYVSTAFVFIYAMWETLVVQNRHCFLKLCKTWICIT